MQPRFTLKTTNGQPTKKKISPNLYSEAISKSCQISADEQSATKYRNAISHSYLQVYYINFLLVMRHTDTILVSINV